MKLARPKAVSVWYENDLIKMDVVNKNDRKEDRKVYATMVRHRDEPTHWYIQGDVLHLRYRGTVRNDSEQ